jgi:hypothetical protein
VPSPTFRLGMVASKRTQANVARSRHRVDLLGAHSTDPTLVVRDLLESAIWSVGRMKLPNVLPLLVILATLTAWSSLARCQDAPKASAKVVRVVDSDPVVIRLDGQDVTARINSRSDV